MNAVFELHNNLFTNIKYTNNIAYCCKFFKWLTGEHATFNLSIVIVTSSTLSKPDF